MLILWVGIVAAMVLSVAWPYVGRASPWFIPVETALGAVAGLLWALLAGSMSARDLFWWGLVWDALYCGVLVGVPVLFFGVKVPALGWLWVAGLVVCTLGLKASMGEQP